MVQGWLRRRIGWFHPSVVAHWGLSELGKLELADFPVSTVDPSEDIRRLAQVPPGSADGLARAVRDLLWDGVTVRSDRACPECGEAELRVLADDAGLLALACDLCAWGEDLRGRAWSGGRLGPAHRASLRGTIWEVP